MTRRGWRAPSTGTSYAGRSFTGSSLTGSSFTGARWRIVVAGLLCALAVIGPAGPASAHATLVSTDPADGAVLDAAPQQAVFTFSETVSLPEGGVSVYDAKGDPLDADATAQDTEMTVDLPGDLADGTYVVAWRVVSADGHPVAGSLTFSVGRASGVVRAPETDPPSEGGTKVPLSIVQGLGYLGLLLAAGLTVFLVLLLPDDNKAGRARGRLLALRRAAAWVAGAAALLALPLSSGYQRGLGLLEALNPVEWAAPSTNDLISAGLVLAGLIVVVGSPASGLTTRGARALPLLGVAALVTAPALAGHSRAFPPELPVLVTDIAHLLAGSVWLGGLVGLAITLPTMAGRAASAADLLGRFSSAAAGTLALLVGSGALLAWRIVGSRDNLFGTGYGRLLLVKLAVVAVAIGVAAVNRYLLLPRTRRAAGFGDGQAAAGAVGRAVTVESGVLVAVLLLTGFLANQPPRPEPLAVPDGRTGVATGSLGELSVLGTLAPRARGQNVLRVQIQDASGEPVAYDARPVVSVRSDDVDLGEVTLRSVATGTFEADVVIPTDGVWTVGVGLRLSRFDNPVTTLEFDVPAD